MGLGIGEWFGWGKWMKGRAAVREADQYEDVGWRRGSLAGGTVPDVEREEIDGEKLLRQAYGAYRSNPLAYAIVEMQTSFVLGGGASVVAEDARVQRVVDRFWKDKENRMGQRLYSLLTELSLFGEQFLRFFIDPMTGRVVIRQLDPLYIKEIETDPEDWERPLRYLWKPPRTDWASDGLDGNWEGEWIPAEEVLHVKVNGMTGRCGVGATWRRCWGMCGGTGSGWMTGCI